MIYTTLNKIRAQGPCSDGWAKLLRHLGKTQADDEPVSLLTILDSNGLDDALWCLRAVDGRGREMRLYAVWCARQVQHLITDQRSLTALDVAECHANGHASDDDLSAASAAAWDAARSAAWDAAWVAARVATRYAAWDAAWDAAWVAARVATRYAAWDAAWDATRSAAWDAARSAAWDAASAAARVATRYAAWDAAWDAASAAARVAQAAEFRRVFCADIEAVEENT